MLAKQLMMDLLDVLVEKFKNESRMTDNQVDDIIYNAILEIKNKLVEDEGKHAPETIPPGTE
jgi:hypothetical protein